MVDPSAVQQEEESLAVGLEILDPIVVDGTAGDEEEESKEQKEEEEEEIHIDPAAED